MKKGALFKTVRVAVVLLVSVAIAVAVGLLLWLLGLDGASWGRGAVVSQ